MYKLINANSNHALQILPYLSTTCYWKEFVEGNILNQSYEEFMLQWIVIPRIPITKVLISTENENKIFGCLIAGTYNDIVSMPDYTPYLNPKVMEIFGSWFTYQISEGIILELYAVDNELRGKGYGSQMLSLTETLALKHQKNSISCFVWNCSLDSIIVATKKKFMIKDNLKFSSPINKDLGLLYMEKTPRYNKLIDYFESSDYKSITNLLLTK